MKKFSSVLMLIVIIGFLSPMFRVFAQGEPTGPCVTDKNTYINVTKAACYLVAKNTGEVVKSWNSTQDIKKAEEIEKRKYILLTPLPGVDGSKSITSFDPEQLDAFGAYLNLMIKIFIGLCAVFAVVMIVIGGIEYMTTELISSKAAGMDRVKGAIFGLILALGAYAILYTINPNLLKTDIQVGGLNVTAPLLNLQTFDVGGAQTFDGKPIKIDFSKESCPAAQVASKATSVDTALILSIFGQESSSGVNTGKFNYQNANIDKPGQTTQLTCLQKMTSLLIANPKNNNRIGGIGDVNMSGSGGGSDHGGAVGLTQFIPCTWMQFREEAKKNLGHEPWPWDVNDALMMTAVKLKNDGGVASPYKAACKYFGTCTNDDGTPRIVNCGNNVKATYGTCIQAKMAYLKEQNACP